MSFVIVVATVITNGGFAIAFFVVVVISFAQGKHANDTNVIV